MKIQPFSVRAGMNNGKYSGKNKKILHGVSLMPLKSAQNFARDIYPSDHRLFFFLLLFIISAFIFLPGNANAKKPVPDGGKISLGPGWRYEPLRGSNSFGANGRFSLQLDSRWFIGVEIGATYGIIDADSLDIEDPLMRMDMQTVVFDLRISAGLHLFEIGATVFYASFGGGYHIAGLSRNSVYEEEAAQGIFVGAGFYFPFNDRMGFFLEDRWTFFTLVETVTGNEYRYIDIGGNLLWFGMVMFFDPVKGVSTGFGD